MTPVMREFLTAWLKWAESEEPDHMFQKQWGLCRAALCFGNGEYSSVVGTDLLNEIFDMFAQDGMAIDYPFGVRAYMNDQNRATMHKDNNRLNWVRSQLAKEE